MKIDLKTTKIFLNVICVVKSSRPIGKKFESK